VIKKIEGFSLARRRADLLGRDRGEGNEHDEDEQFLHGA
jgi:hypothetical protein